MLIRENLIHRYISDESGATAIEYGLIAALIAVGIIVGAKSLGANITGLFGDVDGEVSQAFE